MLDFVDFSRGESLFLVEIYPENGEIKKEQIRWTDLLFSAEREGFEPSVPVRVQRFSRPSRSTTPASFQWSVVFDGGKGTEKIRYAMDLTVKKN